MSDSIKITLTGQEALIARLRNAPERLINLLYDNLQVFSADLRSLAMQLAGSRTGKLASAIQVRTVTTGRTVAVVLFTEGVPYALIQEVGGYIPARVISATKGTALAFAWSKGGARLGDVAFYSYVSWPGAYIPPKHYILNALKDRRAAFEAVCRQTLDRSMAGA